MRKRKAEIFERTGEKEIKSVTDNLNSPTLFKEILCTVKILPSTKQYQMALLVNSKKYIKESKILP